MSRQLSPRAAAGFLRVVSAESAVGATMPRTFFISITNKCNLRCKQCYAAGWDRRTGLTEGQIENAVSDCHASGVDIFTLLGGEPFTRKRLIFSLLERHPDCLFDYTLFGGCFATKGFNTHLNSYGCLEPCPAMHYSTDNLLSGEQSVPELYSRSRLLRGVRGLHDPARVQCPITDRTGDLLRVLWETGATDSTGGRDLGALERFEARSSSCACRSLASMPVPQDVYEPIKLKLLGHLFGERAAADLASAPPPNLESHNQSEDRLGPPPSPRGSNVGRT